jgi:hypothetical protein
MITPLVGEDDMKRLIEQCKLAIKVYDVNDRNRYVKLLPHGPRLYSGSTITTLINNLANILICKAIAESVALNGPADIVAAAARVGYVVTCEKCETPEDIQFLKHSPVVDTAGNLRAMLNLGVLLRASGVCRGELPGKKYVPEKQRAASFQHALLHGMYPRVSFQLLTNMLHQCRNTHEVTLRKAQARVAHKMKYKISADEAEHFSVDSKCVFARYRLTPDQIAQVENGFGTGRYEESFANDALEKILEKDYGLKCRYAK